MKWRRSENSTVCFAASHHRGSPPGGWRRQASSQGSSFCTQNCAVTAGTLFGAAGLYLIFLSAPTSRTCLTVSLLYTILVYRNVSQKHPTSRRWGENCL